MGKSDKKYLRTFRSLLLAHALFVSVLFLIAVGFSIVWSEDKTSLGYGILLGGIGGGLQIASMFYSIPRAVMYRPDDAQKYMLKHYVLRLFIMLVLLFFGILKGKRVLIGITLGLLCVKLGGFFAPKLEHKLYKK